MKVKLKNEKVRISRIDVKDGKYLGIDLYTWKAIHRGETVDVSGLSEEAEEYLVSVEEKVKKKTKAKISKGDK
tara:strand:+ start:310 stop:528 length:219 start_codon:yes stop_codon:yes gene_type:complete